MNKINFYKVLSVCLLLIIALLAYSEISVSRKSNIAEAITGTETQEQSRSDCFRNYTSWPSSSTLKTDSPWSTLILPMRANEYEKVPLRSYMDVNGDGLVDYLYSNSVYSRSYDALHNHTALEECLLLNNGTGWNVAFKCKTLFISDTNTITYYGDCAQL